jgi:hypothetical protein
MLLQRAEGEFKSGRDLRIVFRLRPRCAAISAFALALFPMIFIAITEPSQAATASRETLVTFDVPAQPLASALDRYGDATGREVFYDTVLAAGRRSNGVQGSLTPEAALRALLEGTGLSARFLADGSFVLLPPPGQQSAVRSASSALQQQYYALIQSSLKDAFCRTNSGRPGRYRVVAVFWIDPSGNIERYQRLGSAGAPDIDRGIDDTFRRMRLAEAPPRGFEQPVLIMIVPQARGVTMACEPGDAGQRPARAEP